MCFCCVLYFTFTTDGNSPVRVTLCWTDPPAVPIENTYTIGDGVLDNNTPMLINDLDLRITETANTYYPWKLDVGNPANAATRNTENNVDNVEMVTIDSPTAGVQYTIVIDNLDNKVKDVF